MLGTSVAYVTRQRPRDGSGLCSLSKGFLRIAFFGKLHVFSRLFWREPFRSSGGLLEHQLLFKREHRPRLSGPSARTPTVFPLLDKTFYLLAQGHFGRDGEGTFGEKDDRPRSSKNIFFYLERSNNAQSQVRAGLERNRHRRAPAPGRPQSRRLRVEFL